MQPVTGAPTLSGRSEERARLVGAVKRGLEGSPRMVLVHGEAGIGKTTLVRSVCGEVHRDGAQVLWGQCLHFGEVEAMYHPLVLALEAWLGEAGDEERASVVEAIPGAALVLPSLGALPADRPSALMTVVDALLGRVIARGPSVLVVDDVQWADPATWDALSYLVAGFTRQRMALLTTHRDEAAGSELFRHWLGNVRRLSGIEELALTRLDHDATTDQIAVLLGRPPEPRLVEQVFEKSRGNPYFSELLVRRGDLNSSELPDDLPDELSEALVEAWRGLSTTSREIARILAIGGRPAALRTLAGVAAELGVADAGSVREAVDAGVVVLGGGEYVWFRHPLLSGVLAESYLPGEAAPVHVAWAAQLESVSAEGVEELRRLGDIALHRELAGDGAPAFMALLRGADLAEKLGAPREAADLLVRAADLWQVGADPTDTVGLAQLLERAGNACQWVGRAHEGYRLLRAARDLVSPERHPLWASRLTRRVAGTAFGHGESALISQDLRRAVELSGVDPDSGEHAVALAQLAQGLWWDGQREEACRVIETSVVAAHHSGSASAISCAHGERAMQLMETDVEQADLDWTVCWEHAIASGDPEDIASAYHVRLNLLLARGDLRSLLQHARDEYEWSASLGVTVFPAAHLAVVLLAVGDLNQAEGVVRTGLAASGPPRAEVMIRLQAATLAVRRGANDAARGHLLRARELFPDLEERPEVGAGLNLAEFLLAQDDPVGAFELVERLLPVNTVDMRVVDELMVQAARAAAELVQRASDERDQTAARAYRHALTRLVKSRATLPGILFQPSCSDDTVQPAWAALFAAESSRADGVEDQISPWREAVAACALAGLGWEQQVSTWRLATALIQSGDSGPEAAELLRGVYQYALREGAAPLRAAAEELAASVRMSLAPPHLPSADAVPVAFTGLTSRETQVLAQLVANRTNAEIARTLLISEKTVSVHVSNLLRKTDTGSRREVAALARRVGWGTG
jgi:DNA-binding CsgD family transcriptional regulator/tetratricopeptide (TPR) repeat protein